MLSTGRSGAIPDAGSKARPKVLSKDALSPSESHVSPALCAALEKDLHNWGLAAQSKSPIRYSQSGKAHLKNFRYRTFRCKLLLLARRPDFKSLRKDSRSTGCPGSTVPDAGSKARPSKLKAHKATLVYRILPHSARQLRKICIAGSPWSAVAEVFK